LARQGGWTFGRLDATAQGASISMENTSQLHLPAALQVLTPGFDKTGGRIKLGGVTIDEGASSFVAKAGELYLLSLVDYHVITQHSGFGMTAAMWSRRWHHLYSIDVERGVANRKRKCGVVDYDVTDNVVF
jgi:hypothetical protein